MTTGTTGDEGAEVRAALMRSTEGISGELGSRLRARKYQVPRRYLPVATGMALVAIVALVVSLVTMGGGASNQSGWRLVSYVGTPAWQAEKGQNLHRANDLDCPTVSTCYAIVPGGAGASLVEYTHDGGVTWQESTLPDHTYLVVETLGSDQLACFGNNDCSSVGHGRAGMVFVTTDNGGRSWKLYPETHRLYWNQPITGYACATATTCVAVASAGQDFPPQDIPPAQQKRYTYKNYPGLAFTTTTGWKTWSLHDMPGLFSANSVACVAPARCVTLGQEVTTNGRRQQLVSDDGGVIWTPASGPDWIRSQYLVCSGADCMTTDTVDPEYGSPTGVAISTDYGRTWTTAAGKGYLSEPGNLACATGSYCWVSGDGEVYPSPGEAVQKFELVFTTDQGHAWQEYTFPSSTHILDVGPISCPTATTCYAIAYKTGNSALPVLIRDAG
jgi:hypothetical protein